MPGRSLLWACVLGVSMTGCRAEDDPNASDTDIGSAGATSTSDSGEASGSTSGEPSSTSDSQSTSLGTTAGTTVGEGSDTSATSSMGSDGGSTGPALPEDCTPEAVELVDLVNAYRGENALPPIPLSPSLCIVGQTHVEDLAVDQPHAEPGCNLHSWSDAGSWTPCCYTPDHAEAECMWIKPSELTVYPGSGYENAAGGGDDITPEQALELWQNSPAHDAVILNQDIWSDMPWGAVGAGLYQGYAVLWFGEEPDPRGP